MLIYVYGEPMTGKTMLGHRLTSLTGLGDKSHVIKHIEVENLTRLSDPLGYIRSHITGDGASSVLLVTGPALTFVPMKMCLLGFANRLGIPFFVLEMKQAVEV